jgi:hypothetical protein
LLIDELHIHFKRLHEFEAMGFSKIVGLTATLSNDQMKIIKSRSEEDVKLIDCKLAGEEEGEVEVEWLDLKIKQSRNGALKTNYGPQLRRIL